MRDEVRVAAAQMEVEWLSPQRNREHMIHLLEQAVKENQSELVIFPELANIGYVIGRDHEFGRRYFELAEPLEGPTVEALGRACRQLAVHAVVGLALIHPTLSGGLLNTAVLFDAKGEVCGLTCKLHLSGEEHHYFFAGESLQTFPTEIGVLGLQICYDARFPEVSRVLSLRNAEIICTPFAGPYSEHSSVQRLHWLSATRASENINFFVACNRVGTDEALRFYGRSAIAGPSGQILVCSETDCEEVLYATLKRKELIEERMFRPVFRDRRPELYRAVTEPLLVAPKSAHEALSNEKEAEENVRHTDPS